MVAETGRRSFQWRALLFFEALTLAAGGIGALLGGNFSLDELKAPPLAPPSIAFPVVWSILYLLMGFAAYMVWNAYDIDGPRALRLYLLQLAVNALWPLFYFRLGWRYFDFFWLVLLIALVILTATAFRYIRKPAFYLFIPYILWLFYAAYLNLGYAVLNA